MANGAGPERYSHLHLIVDALHSCQALPMLITGILQSVCRGHEIEQELIYEKLPADIAERHVLLMDPILATGNSAARAIQVRFSGKLPCPLSLAQATAYHSCQPAACLQVLLAKGVRQDKILFLSLIAAPEGIHKICAAFPQVKVITSEIDEAIDESFQVIPGVGEWGERYYS